MCVFNLLGIIKNFVTIFELRFKEIDLKKYLVHKLKKHIKF